MTKDRIIELKEIYSKSLLEDVTPFWTGHSVDSKYGGIMSMLDRNGSVYCTDKLGWAHGRGIWMFFKLYNEIKQEQEWFEIGESAYTFMMNHFFDTDGSMFLRLTRNGRPLMKGRYGYSESFAAIACAQRYKATGDETSLEEAMKLYRKMLKLFEIHPTELDFLPGSLLVKSLSVPMILIVTSREMLSVDSDAQYKKVIQNSIHEVVSYFLRTDENVFVENIGCNGERLDCVEGRIVNPGHAIETAHFIMQEYLNDPLDRRLLAGALKILDISLERGWDKEFGGIFNYLDVEGKPCIKYEWDMKFWWPHSEALYATLLAYHLSGERKYEEWFEQLHYYTFKHFPDLEYGEWYGYLHRDGTSSSTLKGDSWKSFFHIPRSLLLILQLLGKMEYKLNQAKSDICQRT